MRRLLAILVALLLTGIAAYGQVPPQSDLPMSISYITIEATDGTNYSAPCNQLELPSRMNSFLTWSNSTTPGIYYVMLSGYQSRIYTRTNVIGNVNHTTWPLPVAQTKQPIFRFQTSTNIYFWHDVLTITGSLTEPFRVYRIQMEK